MKDEREHAFPVPETDENYFQTGMTLRDYFAGQALKGIAEDYVQDGYPKEGHVKNEMQQLYIASTCYQLADAMIKARTQ